MMKFFLSIILLFLLCDASAQLNPKYGHSTHFVFTNMHMTLTNNFIEYPKYKVQPVDISLPFADENAIVYGEKITLSIFEAEFRTMGDHHGMFFFDTIPADQNKLQVGSLQTRLLVNGMIVRNWKPVNQNPSFDDIWTHSNIHDSKPGKFFQEIIETIPSKKYFQAINDHLNIGDEFLIEFRNNSDSPFYKFSGERRNAYTQPYMMSYTADTGRSEQDFIQHQVTEVAQNVHANLFYTDWPRSGLTLDRKEFLPNTRLAFYFRHDKTRDDSSLLFRLHGGRFDDTDWQRTSGQIIISALEPHTSYKLEVKYANGKGSVSTYSFHTPAKWYQTPIFQYVLVGLAVMIILAVLLFMQVRRRRRFRKLNDLEVQALYSRMNPHFLFNALSSIQGLINDDRPEEANRYLTQFSALLRDSLSQNKQNLVSLRSDLKNIHRYVELEKLRFNFLYEESIDETLLEKLELPPLLAQPLIENAVKHGLAGMSDSGKLIYSIRAEGADVSIKIIDNGRGFDSQKVYEGQGLQLVKERLGILNRMHKRRPINLNIQSSANGTQAEILLKNWLA